MQNKRDREPCKKCPMDYCNRQCYLNEEFLRKMIKVDPL